MITVANRIFVAPEFTEQFEEAFRKRAGLVDGMPGFVSNQVLRPVNPGDPYIVLTLWNARADFEAWIHSDAFVQGHAKSGSLPKEAFTARINWKSTRLFRTPAALISPPNRLLEGPVNAATEFGLNNPGMKTISERIKNARRFDCLSCTKKRTLTTPKRCNSSLKTLVITPS